VQGELSEALDAPRREAQAAETEADLRVMFEKAAMEIRALRTQPFDFSLAETPETPGTPEPQLQVETDTDLDLIADLFDVDKDPRNPSTPRWNADRLQKFSGRLKAVKADNKWTYAQMAAHAKATVGLDMDPSSYCGWVKCRFSPQPVNTPLVLAWLEAVEAEAMAWIEAID
jgi:hypothetical protein